MTTPNSDLDLELLGRRVEAKTSKPGLVFLLIVVVPIAAVFAFGAVLLTVGLVLGKLPEGAFGMVVAFAVCFGGALFFASVARGLLGTIRGRDVPHLVPPWLIVPLCFALGVGTLVAIVVHPQPKSANAGIAAGLFLGYAIRETRAWVLRRRGAADSPR